MQRSDDTAVQRHHKALEQRLSGVAHASWLLRLAESAAAIARTTDSGELIVRAFARPPCTSPAKRRSAVR